MRPMVAVIPLKALDRAKSRLGEVLDADARHDLALTMLARTVDACRGAGLDPWVVSPDPAVHASAEVLGARSLDDGGVDLTAAVALALAHHATAAIIVVVAADLPEITAEALLELIAQARPLALVAAADGTTNAIAACPPAVFTPSYGPGSAARHGGLHVRIAELERDLDTPADLRRVLAPCG